jgi:phage terminase Nu1 subunit (DNA packaging protein)
MDRTITRAELARLARVSKPAITKWLSKHASARAGERVKLDAPEVVAYLAAKGHVVAPPPPSGPAETAPPAAPAAAPTKTPRQPKAKPPAPTASSKGARRQRAAPTAPPPPDPPPAPAPRAPGKRSGRAKGPAPTVDEQGFVDELADLTLLQICERYGTVSAYKNHLEAFEKRERALKYRLENEEAEGRLISRELVTKVMGAFDGANRKLLGDGPKTISRRVYAMARSDQAIEEAEATVHEIISTILKSVKKAAREVVNDG